MIEDYTVEFTETTAYKVSVAASSEEEARQVALSYNRNHIGVVSNELVSTSVRVAEDLPF